jgi:predicted alpha/beta-fold hydrolase
LYAHCCQVPADQIDFLDISELNSIGLYPILQPHPAVPIIPESSYQAPFGYRNGHLQTIYPTLFRKVPPQTHERERITTPDDDFLDLDWARGQRSDRVAILSHGLEGSSKATYIQGMTRALVNAGWHVLAWNFRSCSGEPNRQLRSYHSGSIEDLQSVLHHVGHGQRYQSIALIGFSLGGNLMLKLLGELGQDIDRRICAAVAFSVPCDLAASAKRLEHVTNRLYMHRFLRTLSAKIREKVQRFPGRIHADGLAQMRSFREFDQSYTAPIHGFSSAEDYWAQCSCSSVLTNITIPTLLINAKNDPFLTPSCFPLEAARRNPQLHLETPQHGGHLGFVQFKDNGVYWSEQRALQFLQVMRDGKSSTETTRKVSAHA